MKTKAAIVLTIAVLSTCLPILAHHGNAAFDLTQFVTLKATVTEFVWSNPHSQIYFDVTNDKGQVTHWSCETVQPALLHRAGWTRESLKPGDQVTIVAHPSKSGAPVAYLSGGKIILADGKELKMDIPQQ
jgi:hypothetical protein